MNKSMITIKIIIEPNCHTGGSNKSSAIQINTYSTTIIEIC